MKRWIHGLVAVSCFALIASGLVLFVPPLAQAAGFQVVQFIRLSHRVFGLLFIAAPLYGLVTAPKGFVHIVKNLLAPWDADDKKFMMLFPKYLFSSKTTHMPKQYEVKSGQRLADGLLILSSVLIAVTGVILWAGASVPPGVLRPALLLHDVAFFLIALIMCAHLYLGAGIFQPYRGSVRLMFGDGRVSESDALYHWGHWAEAELKSGKNVVVVDD
jgi:formate dehydrogenase subunit gamma